MSYSAYTAIPAEGRRIGIVTCLTCGAAVLLDEDKGTEIHTRWHAVKPQLLPAPTVGKQGREGGE